MVFVRCTAAVYTQIVMDWVLAEPRKISFVKNIYMHGGNIPIIFRITEYYSIVMCFALSKNLIHQTSKNFEQSNAVATLTYFVSTITQNHKTVTS